ncbi:uncharacterized protein LOC143244454 isoform X2 [Tachypleus tridentatus]|uniref:uncharacterized protein LOC143244454 isoform X2 n=1 Tax=Tachypleus tridentatus TaxID=6853 RepID=UPI003FD006A8
MDENSLCNDGRYGNITEDQESWSNRKLPNKKLYEKESKATMDYPQKIKPGIPVLFQAIKPQSPNLLCEGGKDTVPDHPLVDSFIP